MFLIFCRTFESLLQLTIERLAPFGNDKQSFHTNFSRTISLSLLAENGAEVSIKTSPNDPFVVVIPNDPEVFQPEMFVQSVASASNLSLFNNHYVPLTPSKPASIQLEFQSLNRNLSYLLVYRFDQLPIFNTSVSLIDGGTLFCSTNQNSSSSSSFQYHINDEQTVDHHSFIFSLRELNASEVKQFCRNNSNSTLPRTDQRINFTADYRLRLYQSGCYYLNANNQWKSDGMRVSAK